VKKYIIENFKTLIYALIIAVIIRSLFFQPFYIPSSSMEPTLLVGDRLFVSKYSYGYSRHSFPFSPKLTNKRLLITEPERGEVVVFKTPADNRTDYIKRVIGLPGDTLQIINGSLYLNEYKVKTKKVNLLNRINCGGIIYDVNALEESMPNGKKYIVTYKKESSMQNTDKFIVPKDHYFFMGDNRDCSKDSRFLTSVGYVHIRNLVGKAQVIFFSNDRKVGNLFQFWKWKKILRIDRFFKRII